MEYRRVFAKVNLDAIGKNISLIQNRIPEGVGIMPIIKADAYGHGAVEIARFLHNRATYFGVAAVDEAIELRRAGIDTPILILGYTFPDFYDDIVTYDITPAIFSYKNACLLDKVARSKGKIANIHIVVDTGMSRIGYQVCEESADEVKKISELKNLCVEGIFSHFATADEEDLGESHRQRERFDAFLAMLKERGVEPRLRHLNNSAGIMNMNDNCYDMVRAGIILYGLYPSDEVDKESFPLVPAMELITHISHVKTLPAGRGISYGHTFVTDRETVVATVPVGYADGYPRALSGVGDVLISGVRCPILGRVCMDQMMVDVTNVPGARVGDIVTLVGRDGAECITVEELAKPAASFNYEFVCNISRRVPHAYFRRGEHIKTVSYLDYEAK